MVRMAVRLEEISSYYQLNLGKCPASERQLCKCQMEESLWVWKIVPTSLEKLDSFVKSSVHIYNMTEQFTSRHLSNLHESIC